MKFPIIRDFPGHQRKTGVSKSKLCATCDPIPLQLWSSSISGLSRAGCNCNKTTSTMIGREVKCIKVSGGRLEARGKLVACELAPLCCTLRVCLDGISAVKHGSLMWGQASQALGTNPEGDYSPAEQPYTTGSMPSVQPPFPSSPSPPLLDSR